MICNWSATVLLVLLTLSSAWAQGTKPSTEDAPAEKQALRPLLFTDFGTFEKVQDGWRCKSVGSRRPDLLRELQIGDVISSIDNVKLAESTAIGMLQLLRRVEFGLADAIEASRVYDKGMKWIAPVSRQILASQYSMKVLRSDVAGIEPGDVLTAIGPSSFASMLEKVENPLAVVVTAELRPRNVLRFTRNGESREMTASESSAVRLVQFDGASAQVGLQDLFLHGVNTPDISLGSLHGRWALLHFWATWCKPCIRHLPDTRELSQQPDLTLAAIGFADTEARLAAMAAAEKDIKIYQPSPELQRELAITGIPFDVMLDPKGSAMLVISGDMPGDELKEIVTYYVRHSL